MRVARGLLLLAATLALGWATPAIAQGNGTSPPADPGPSEGGPHLVLGEWPNPLPPPLDGVFGTFLLEVLVWLALATLVRLIVGPALKAVTRRTKTALDDKAIDILGTPLFIVVLFLGVRSSLRVFELSSPLAGTLKVAASVLTILLIAYVFYRAWNEVALVYAKKLAERTHSGRIDRRLLPVLENFGGVVIVLFATVFVFNALGVSLGWLLAGSAFLSIVVGLAAQDTLSNFFSGMHLLLDQPFREGDEIQIESGEICIVRRIGLRSSHLYHTRNHELIIVPNNLLATDKVTNLMRPDRRQRVWIDVGVGYESDPDQVRRILSEAALAHPLVLRERGNEPQVRLMDFGPPALRYTLVFWVADHSQRNPVASDLRIAILRRFKEAGIEIPDVSMAMQAYDGDDRATGQRRRR